eukprot:8748384-Karenia_brevis.AAC.1
MSPEMCSQLDSRALLVEGGLSLPLLVAYMQKIFPCMPGKPAAQCSTTAVRITGTEAAEFKLAH